MKNRILVTYASRTGWTPGVAEEIGKTLSDGGAEVEVRPLSEVNDLSAYDAVVAGSGINDRMWHPEAVEFVRAHQAELSQKPFAVFLVCMTLAMKNGEQYRGNVSTWLDPVCALVQPVSRGLFAGGLDISKVPTFKNRMMFRMSVLFGVWKEGDHRNWDAIRKWAAELKPLMLK